MYAFGSFIIQEVFGSVLMWLCMAHLCISSFIPSLPSDIRVHWLFFSAGGRERTPSEMGRGWLPQTLAQHHAFLQTTERRHCSLCGEISKR